MERCQCEVAVPYQAPRAVRGSMPCSRLCQGGELAPLQLLVYVWVGLQPATLRSPSQVCTFCSLSLLYLDSDSIYIVYVFFFLCTFSSVCCFAPTDHSKFLICVNLLGNKSDSDSDFCFKWMFLLWSNLWNLKYSQCHFSWEYLCCSSAVLKVTGLVMRDVSSALQARFQCVRLHHLVSSLTEVQRLLLISLE